jgi:hypothetical protein
MDRVMAGSGLSELSVRQLQARRRRLVGAVADLDGTLRGALLSRGRRCSSEGCHCRRGELHGPYPYLSIYDQGRSRTVYVPAPLEPVVAGHVAVTQRNDALLAEISQINLELLRRRALE